MTATNMTPRRAARRRQLGARSSAVAGRLAALAAALGLGLAAAPAAADGVNAPLAEADGIAAPLADGDWALSGAYLRARVAAQRNDMKAAARAFQRAARLNSADTTLLESGLFFSLVVGDVAEAIEFADTLRESDGDNGLRLILVVVDAIAAGEFEAARALLADGPAGAQIPPFLKRLAAGWVEAGLGDLERARGAFLERQSGEPDIVDLLAGYHAAMLQSVQGEPTEAAEALLAVAAIAEEGEPSLARNGRFAVAVAAALARVGRLDDASAFLAEAAAGGAFSPVIEEAQRLLNENQALTPPVQTPREGVAEALYAYAGALAGDDNRRQGALAYVQMALFLRPDLDEARLLAGELLALSSQYEAAAAAFARVDPAGIFGEAGASAQSAAFRRLGDFEQALAALSAYSAFVGAPGPQIEMERASVLQAMREFEQCAAVYGAALQEIAGPDGAFSRSDWNELFGHAICLERSGDWDAAEARLRETLVLYPDQPEVLNYLGYSLVEQRRDLEEALELLRRAAERRPTSGHIVDSLGWALYRLGRYGEAVAHLQRAAELEPTIAVINDHLGDALWKVGRLYEARFHWKRALSLEDDIGEVDRARVEDKLARGLDAVLDDELAATEADDASPSAPKPESDG